MTGPTQNEAHPQAGRGRTDEPTLYTAEEAANLLRLSRSTLYEFMWSDQLVPIRIGRRIRFTRGALEGLVAELAKHG